MGNYSEDELLMLSGIQHFAFCERQWALIHIEQQWSENLFTVEGHHMHEKADDPFSEENRGDTSFLRSLSLVSFTLGLNGIADVVEIKRISEHDTGVTLMGKTGHWKLTPVEYKRGKPKPDERDEVQLCAQAVCLEEMYNTVIEKGYLYYGETRHRHEVIFTGFLRQKVLHYSVRMHKLFNNGETPLPVFKPHCTSCSLKDICMPNAFTNKSLGKEYNRRILFD